MLSTRDRATARCWTRVGGGRDERGGASTRFECVGKYELGFKIICALRMIVLHVGCCLHCHSFAEICVITGFSAFHRACSTS